ncbi:MAG: FAD-binding oxidoreductase [Candidatus Saccharicenans sp.]|uniref:FAD-binding oxidoreductase n=1 Tax=Candidatus Saccharicenans sp. TaxID=2819258 RepID=UPI00404923C7
MYGKIDQGIIKELVALCGENNVLSCRDEVCGYTYDEYVSQWPGCAPEVVVRPGSTEEVSAILKLASEHKIPVTPRGGGTGLAGGCVPVQGGLVLSMQRMNRFLELDRKNQLAVVESGITLGEFIQSVEREGFYFPPHPGDEGAMFGGMIATNAGGSRAVKYGSIRNYIRGLQVVLADGQVIHPGGKLIKNSTGYNLVNLFIGSEGTLGVITRAIVQVMSRPTYLRTMVIPFNSIEQAIDNVPLMFERGIMPMAVEFVGLDVISLSERHLNLNWPTHQGEVHLMVIVDSPSEDDLSRLTDQIADVVLENGAIDVFVADTPAKQAEVLKIRSEIYEAIKKETVDILDICVPRSEIAGHVRKIQEVARKYDLWLPVFGHAGDGNVHSHLMKARYENGQMVPLALEELQERLEAARQELFRDAAGRGGVISGEHGIGLYKKKYLPLSLEPAQIELMKKIKQALDPQSLLNPGKIFD